MRQLLVCRRASRRWRSLEPTRPGERIHEAIERLRDALDGDLLAVRPLDEVDVVTSADAQERRQA